SGGSLTGTLVKLPGGEPVPLGGQAKGSENPSTPGDNIAGWNWGFITGTPHALPPATDCTAEVFGGNDCGSIKEHIYPGAAPLTNTISLSAGSSFGLLVPGNAIYTEGPKQFPQAADKW